MKIGIFADIHGNIYAFKEIYKSLIKAKLDLNIFCGDICGYYYYQNEVIGILKEMKNLICIAGNHDEMFLRMLEEPAEEPTLENEYESRYGKSNRILKETIKKDNLDFLRKLPEEYYLKNFKLAVFHGSPWNHLDEYIYPGDSLDRFNELPYRFIFLGHTHYPMDRTINHIRIINPGSSGQPRDNNQPSFAVFDLESGEIEFKHIQYDSDLIVRDIIRRREKNPYLIEVLKRKR